jgi:alditol oxidase
VLRLPGDWVWDSWIADDGDLYHLFFLHAPRALVDPGLRHTAATVGHATSADLRQWEHVGEALGPGPEGAWDDLAVWTGSVARGDDGVWRMYYTALSSRGHGVRDQRIGLAESDDLMTWRRAGDRPLLEADPRWYRTLEDAGPAHPASETWRDPFVLRDPSGDGWHMLITARDPVAPRLSDGVLGHARSADMRSWEVQPPLSEPSGFGQVEVPQVREVDGRAVLVFTCHPEEQSEAQKERFGLFSTWYVVGDSVLGPWDLDSARPFVDDPKLFAAPLVRDRDGHWAFVGFRNQEPEGILSFEIMDPIPVELDGGTLRESTRGPGRNWGGNHRYRATRLHRPSTVEQLQEIVASAAEIRVLGSRHSFSGIADAAELVTLDHLPPDVRVDREAGTVDVPGAIRYGELAEALEAEGLALHNLASLPHISVAGAVATATHGSGDASGNLATAVAAIEIVTSTGAVVRASRGEDRFDGLVVNLGALGAVTRLTLDVEPAYEVRQRVFEGLAWDALLDHHDEIAAAGDSVSVFTRWGDMVDQVWVKSRVAASEEPREDLFGARPASVDRHPILGLDAVNCTPQLGAAGPWHDRLPHFRMGFTPSAGDEIQSEYLLPRPNARAAIEALRGLAGTVRPVLQVSELRTIAADRLWLSPQHRRDTIGVHFTWQPDQPAVERVLRDVEAALLPLDARPHWGKLFLADADEIAPRYERLEDFRALAGELDPRGAFRNAWIERHLFADG